MGNCQHGNGIGCISRRSKSKGRFNQSNRSKHSPTNEELQTSLTSHVKMVKQGILKGGNPTQSIKSKPWNSSTADAGVQSFQNPSNVKGDKQMPGIQSCKSIHSIAEHKAQERPSNHTYSRNLITPAKTTTMQLDVRTDLQAVGNNRGDGTPRAHSISALNETKDYSGIPTYSRNLITPAKASTMQLDVRTNFQTVGKNRGDDTTRSDWSSPLNETKDYSGCGPYPVRVEKAGDEESNIKTHKEATPKNKRTKQIEKLEARIKILTEEKNKLLDRLSEIGALKLTENNPNITDLSDANRPEKLVEQLSELYDNEWTEAYLHLTNTQGKMVDQAVKLLLQALKLVYGICLSSMDERAKTLRKAIVTCVGLSEEESNELELKEIERKMWAYRQKKTQSNLPRIKEEVKKKFREQLKTDLSRTLTLYIDGCVHICWFMCIKNPPMHLDFGETELRTIANNDKSVTNHFDKTKFVTYTKSGDYIDYVVWPAVYLHERGQIMKKGVAQGSTHLTNMLTDVA